MDVIGVSTSTRRNAANVIMVSSASSSKRTGKVDQSLGSGQRWDRMVMGMGKFHSQRSPFECGSIGIDGADGGGLFLKGDKGVTFEGIVDARDWAKVAEEGLDGGGRGLGGDSVNKEPSLGHREIAV